VRADRALATQKSQQPATGRPSVADALTLARWAVLTAMLAGAAWSDWRTRRVPNRYWWPFVALAASGWVMQVVLDGATRALWVAALVATGSCIAFYALWWTRGLFGGADAKALMVCAWLVPVPLSTAPGLVPVWDLFMDALVLFLAIPLGIAAWNLAHRRWGGWATFTSVPMPLARARDAKVWPHEVVVDGVVRRRAMQRLDADLATRYDGLEAAGVTDVWATPKVPFAVVLLFGAGLAAWQGNLLLRAVAALMGRPL
jgi:Flp pilus assembly protein protease CpaA